MKEKTVRRNTVLLLHALSCLSRKGTNTDAQKSAAASLLRTLSFERKGLWWHVGQVFKTMKVTNNRKKTMQELRFMQYKKNCKVELSTTEFCENKEHVCYPVKRGRVSWEFLHRLWHGALLNDDLMTFGRAYQASLLYEFVKQNFVFHHTCKVFLGLRKHFHFRMLTTLGKKTLLSYFI